VSASVPRPEADVKDGILDKGYVKQLLQFLQFSLDGKHYIGFLEKGFRVLSTF
jgi:hypothetical protein